MFIQIHTLTGYANVLLNRDDAGMAKRTTYGDATRTRTSSQFAKRKIRTHHGEHSINDDRIGMSVRSRALFRRNIAQPLIEAGHPAEAVVKTTLQLMDRIYKPSAGALKTRKETEGKIAAGEKALIDLLDRNEINILSKSEIEYLKSLVETCLTSPGGADKAMTALLAGKSFIDNLRKVGSAMSIDVAMFGRMVTGDALSSVDAAVHVAHAMTVHRQAAETDFFTAVDDLVTGDQDNGGGHLGEVEITTPLLYGYYVVDLRQLLDNLAGTDNAHEISAEMVVHLIGLVTECIVGAKKGSTAPYSSADFVMVEFGKAQPRTLAEAFRKPVDANAGAAILALQSYLDGKDRMYGRRGVERFVACASEAAPVFGEQLTVEEIAEAAASKIMASAPVKEEA